MTPPMKLQISSCFMCYYKSSPQPVPSIFKKFKRSNPFFLEIKSFVFNGDFLLQKIRFSDDRITQSSPVLSDGKNHTRNRYG
jgi:hypothetical protein